jgi:hypothetical protein
MMALLSRAAMRRVIPLPLLVLLAGLNPAVAQPAQAPDQPPEELTPAQPPPIPPPENLSPSSTVIPPSWTVAPGSVDSSSNKYVREVCGAQFMEISDEYRNLRTCIYRLQAADIKLDELQEELRACLESRDPTRTLTAAAKGAEPNFVPSIPEPLVSSPSSNQATSVPVIYDALLRENQLLKSKSYAALQAYTQYYYDTHARRMADLRHNTFVWQARASEILIWVVVVVCLSGVVFSGYQLWRATSPRAFAGSTVKADGDPLATNIELSLQNVRVTSSVIGLVVLVISVAYLYLFLKEVYRIDMAEELPASSPVTESPIKNATTAKE